MALQLDREHDSRFRALKERHALRKQLIQFKDGSTPEDAVSRSWLNFPWHSGHS